MDNRGYVNITVFDKTLNHNSGYDWPNNNLQQTIHWFKMKLHSIPRQYRADASCYLDVGYMHSRDSAPRILICYSRPQTNIEAAGFLRETQTQADERELGERETLRVLKAKYEDG